MWQKKGFDNNWKLNNRIQCDTKRLLSPFLVIVHRMPLPYNLKTIGRWGQGEKTVVKDAL